MQKPIIQRPMDQQISYRVFAGQFVQLISNVDWRV